MRRFLFAVLLLSGCRRLDVLMNGESDNPNIPPVVPIIGHEVWLLMGQSNMTGADEPGFDPGPYIEMVYSGANLATHQPKENGPGIPFAYERARKGYSVTLIQCAVGGTKIDRWIPGGDLYESCMNLALSTYPIRGVLFSQGENDTTFGAPWAAQFTLTVAGLRSNFGNIPIVFTQLGQNPGANNPGENPFYAQIKAEQTSVSLPNVTMIQQDDLPLCGGGWHLCRSSYMTVGQRMALAIY